jgi:hypothetical protein
MEETRGKKVKVRTRQLATPMAEMTPKRKKVSSELAVKERSAPAVVRVVTRQAGPISEAAFIIAERAPSLEEQSGLFSA